MKGNIRIPSDAAIRRRVKGKNYIHKKCPYLPCHTELESCNLCYCIFYPCEDDTKGGYVISKKIGRVWSCMECNWIHREDVVNRLREFLNKSDSGNALPKELYGKFIDYLRINIF